MIATLACNELMIFEQQWEEKEKYSKNSDKTITRNASNEKIYWLILAIKQDFFSEFLTTLNMSSWKSYGNHCLTFSIFPSFNHKSSVDQDIYSFLFPFL